MRGLEFFRRTNDPRSFNLASYHDPRSITWSWLICWTWYSADEKRRWFGWARWRKPYGFWQVNLLKLGTLRYSYQPKMIRKCAVA